MTNTKKINIGDVLQYYEAEKRDPQQNVVKESEAERHKKNDRSPHLWPLSVYNQ